MKERDGRVRMHTLEVVAGAIHEDADRVDQDIDAFEKRYQSCSVVDAREVQLDEAALLGCTRVRQRMARAANYRVTIREQGRRDLRTEESS
ncbi:hypothetical protein GCM10010985_56080 [Caballeronia grimmiae]|uniref:Uncharacterized protein n=1 Tax=Caballeronia grimmiae TaxID=1071679 RepID=A0ABQ1S4U2_9BURK|nr:hypothetical protein GCM10010985_56080 [Caballeronia grimmiae]